MRAFFQSSPPLDELLTTPLKSQKLRELHSWRPPPEGLWEGETLRPPRFGLTAGCLQPCSAIFGPQTYIFIEVFMVNN